MPLPFDATLKDLAQVSPHGLLATFDTAPTLPVSLLNVDLSTVTTSTDLVFGLGQPPHHIVHLDFQSSASATKHADILVYNALLYRQYQVSVHTIVVLLRPQAAHPNLNGSVAYAPRPGKGKMDYQYELIRLWERPAAELLAGDIGVVPLALLGQLPAEVDFETGLADVTQRLIERLEREAPPEQTRRLLTAAFVLAGLRVSRPLALQLFQGVQAMRESVTYQAILDEGREEGREQGREQGRIDEVKKMIVRLGSKWLGAPGENVTAMLDALTDLEQLELLLEHLKDVQSWDELLALP